LGNGSNKFGNHWASTSADFGSKKGNRGYSKKREGDVVHCNKLFQGERQLVSSDGAAVLLGVLIRCQKWQNRSNGWVMI